MKSIIILLISFLVISCKSNSKLIGEYQTNSSGNTEYIFNLSNKQYTQKLGNRGYAKGKFKILVLSSEKTLLVCNDMILKKIDGFIKEKENASDSISIFNLNGYKNLGSTVFEITSKEETLTYRKTYTNDLKKTESEGALIKIQQFGKIAGSVLN